MDELAQKVATLEARATYQDEDVRALKAENKETLRAFQEMYKTLEGMRVSVEVLNAKLAAADRKHTDDSADIKSEVDRWTEIGFKIAMTALGAFIAANIGGLS